ncbi:MAG: hypothetical protein KME64_05925 [Scytonematopsis contorta HA4267-MV1]|jgi:hypothetical protein|nr:hypothetical protein [Scytonematopsis contorta HA4267-MV1]
MSFFNDSVPPLRRKQAFIDTQDLEGLLRVNWRIGEIQLYSTFYTRIDQAFLIWGLLLLLMFVTAQFFPVDWSLQATLWSTLSCIGLSAMFKWTEYWVERRQVRWILYCWLMLMLVGVILTDLGIFFSWSSILIYLCPLWLGLTALGYLCTGFGVHSRSLLIIGAMHLLGILILPFIGSWQFLTTGMLMVVCLVILAEFEWDHL